MYVFCDHLYAGDQTLGLSGVDTRMDGMKRGEEKCQFCG